MKKTPKHTPALDKARVLELLASGANKRDLAKKLSLKGSDRIQLKRILKELQAEGGKAAAWEVTYTSEAKGRSRTRKKKQATATRPGTSVQRKTWR